MIHDQKPGKPGNRIRHARHAAMFCMHEYVKAELEQVTQTMIGNAFHFVHSYHPDVKIHTLKLCWRWTRTWSMLLQTSSVDGTRALAKVAALVVVAVCSPFGPCKQRACVCAVSLCIDRACSSLEPCTSLWQTCVHVHAYCSNSVYCVLENGMTTYTWQAM